MNAEQNDNGNNASIDALLLKACAEVIRKAWVAYYRVEPDAKQDRNLSALAEQWAEVIGDSIPPQRLHKVYVTYLREARDLKTGKRPRYFPAPQDLLDQWDALNETSAQAVAAQRLAHALPRIVEGVAVYRCPHCLDQTEQAIWRRSRLGWYQALRGCECAATPLNRRSPQAIYQAGQAGQQWGGFVLSECGEWVCQRLQQRWVRVRDLRDYGCPVAAPEWVRLRKALRQELEQAA